MSKANTLKVKVTGNCYVYATIDMICPLCRCLVPASTAHECELTEPVAPKRRGATCRKR